MGYDLQTHVMQIQLEKYGDIAELINICKGCDVILAPTVSKK